MLSKAPSYSTTTSSYSCKTRAVSRSENPGGGTYYWVGIMCPPLVEIELADLPKSGGGARAPRPPHLLRACTITCLINGHARLFIFCLNSYGTIPLLRQRKIN